MSIVALLILFIVILLCCRYRKKRRPAPAVRQAKNPPPGGESRTLFPAPFNPRGAQALGSDEGSGDQGLSAGVYPETGSGHFQPFAAAKVEMIFSLEEASGDREKPLLTLADVRPDVLREVRKQIGTLKNIDAIQELQKMVGTPDTTMNALTRLITRNPILSAKILQVANSSYYGMQQKLNSISHALMIIGMANLKAILYHEGVLNALREKNFRDRPDLQALCQHVNYTSIIASYVHYLFEGLNMGTLFTLGLLHDMGKFIMFRLAPGERGDPGGAGGYSPDWAIAREETTCGIHHALVGRLALQHWGLSPLMVEAVTLHHALPCLPPAELGLNREELSYLLVLFLSDQAAHLFAGRSEVEAVRPDRLHPAYHGLIDKGKLIRLLQDKSLLAQLQEAKAIAGVYL